MSDVREAGREIRGPSRAIPTVLIEPSDGVAHPVLVMLHGTGASKQRWVGRARTLAARGITVAVPDARLHGERRVLDLDPNGPVPILSCLSIVDGTADDVSAILDAVLDA